MTLTLTPDTPNARIQIATAGMPPAVAGATVVTGIVQRSIDQIRWTIVRSAAQITIDGSGNIATISDYEFAPGVVNFYRAGVNTRGVDTFSRTSATTWSAADTGQTYVRNGGADADFAVAAGIGTASHGAVNTLKGQAIDVGSGEQQIVIDVMLAVGSSLGAPITQWVCGRYSDANNYYNAQLNLNGAVVTVVLAKRVAGVLTVLATSGTLDAAHAGSDWWRVKLDTLGSTIRTKAWKRTLAEPPAYQLTVTDTSLNSGTQAAALSRLETGNTNTTPVVVSFDNFFINTGSPQFTQAANITPTLDRVWLKSPSRPFLNRPVTVVGWSDVARPDRSADFDVVGRSFPVAITDLRGSRHVALELYTATGDDAQTMDYVLASGDILFVHTPLVCDVPGGYMRVGDTNERKTRPRGVSRVFALPLVEVAAPGPDVAGNISTWQTVLNSYATWSALLAANPTWADLLARIAPPSEVVVP